MVKYIFVYCIFVFTASCSVSTLKRNEDFKTWRNTNKIKVLATTEIIADLVRKIGGDHIDVISIIGGDLNPHSYEIVKGDGEKIDIADVIFANGLSLEHSASMRYQLERHRNTIYLGDDVMKRHPEMILRVDNQVDPHIWMDVVIWRECIDPIVSSLSILDEKHSLDYLNMGEIAKGILSLQNIKMKDKLGSIPDNKRYLVTSHDAFNYFVRRYFATDGESDWKKRVNAIQGLAPDEQISPLEIIKVVDYVLAHNVSVIFPEQNLSQDSLNKVVDSCKKKGSDVSLSSEMLYGDTMGGNTYIGMLDSNTEVIYGNLLK